MGLNYRSLKILSHDNVELAGWFVSSKTDDEKVKTPLIVIHGLGANKQFMMSYIQLAHELGFPVLAVDLRGHGESGPSIVTLGLKESLDLEKWVEELKKQGYSKPILWGTSLGAVTALLAGSRLKGQLRAIIADAPFDNLYNALVTHAQFFFKLKPFPMVPIVSWHLKKNFGIDPLAIDCVHAAQNIDCPLFILAAEKDARMPLAMVRRVFDAAKSPKSWWIIPNANHEIRTFDNHFKKTITQFLYDI
ncbi:alpha/beta hydrolase [Methylacidiphilum caldifontis]|uniref:Alpha/beta hydrolase n=1 Tax=Methylacidiphilum caldifontis TaxID=2795386 RepID=A0A4Y8P9Q7_9BACT|nr:alpha/beta hydrolase [Methylacidiphilum caldifontis]